jgi:phage replication-related protein YjqB (UPF0714/DUF867 family)
MSTFQGQIRRAVTSQETLLNRSEHCSLDPERLAELGAGPGRQIRIRRSDTLVALYTVSETRQETDDSAVRMALVGRERLGSEDEFEATIDTLVVNPSISDEDASTTSEFVERLDDDGYQRSLVALAPHGGMIEEFTDRQAETVATALGSGRASAWRCKGFSEAHGASRLWHVTSSELHDDSFPLLRSISQRKFRHAVAFHGFKEDGILLGGSAPLSFKQEIAAAIRLVLRGSTIDVRIADPADAFDGDSPANIVNRLTAGGSNGVQIEQSIEARRQFWEPIATAVALVYAGRLSCEERLHEWLDAVLTHGSREAPVPPLTGAAAPPRAGRLA